jgi:hypothetical protein
MRGRDDGRFLSVQTAERLPGYGHPPLPAIFQPSSTLRWSDGDRFPTHLRHPATEGVPTIPPGRLRNDLIAVVVAAATSYPLGALEIATTRLAGETIRAAFPRDSGVVQHIDPIGMRQREGHILFAQQHRDLGGLPQRLQRLR